MSDSVRGHFVSVNRRVLEMAKDFPADKYNYSLKPEMCSFGAAIVHIASGNVHAAKAGRGENVNWDELDPKNYKTKDEVVALLIEEHLRCERNPEDPAGRIVCQER